MGCIGVGAYGSVYKCRDLISNKIVACKVIWRCLEDACTTKQVVREIHSLLALRGHPNIVHLCDVVLPESPKTGLNVCLVFDYVETDLHKILHSDQALGMDHVVFIIYQLLMAVAYSHKRGIIHRDMKPANILITEKVEIRLADYGMSRVIGEAPVSPAGITLQPLQRQLTQKVVTRWYRAPEIILKLEYGPPVDMWSLGCILGELLLTMLHKGTRSHGGCMAVFQGGSCFPLSKDRHYKNDADYVNDQLAVILQNLGMTHPPGGTPDPRLKDLRVKDERDQAYIHEMATFRGPRVSIFDSLTVAGVDPLAVKLLRGCLELDPAKRLTAQDALRSPLFDLFPVRDVDLEEEMIKSATGLADPDPLLTLPLTPGEMLSNLKKDVVNPHE